MSAHDQTEPEPEPTAAQILPDSLQNGLSQDFPGYEILSELGRGGMSVVYKARSILTGQLLAIKVLKPGYEDLPAYLQRFANEARALSMLDDPGVVRVYKWALSKSGAPFLVMEYLEGKTLAQLLKENKRLSASCFESVFDQVLQALSRVHEKQLLHRDLKPENIMLLEADDALKVKLLDFGIAKNLAGLSKDQQLTCGLLGTPLYMSPEQCAGGAPDARSDIYAVACLMYECVCGQAPFAAESDMQTMYRRLSSSSPTKAKLFAAADYPHSVLELILKGLQRDPDKRPQSASSFQAEMKIAFVEPPAAEGKPVFLTGKRLVLASLSLSIFLGGIFAFLFFRQQSIVSDLTLNKNRPRHANLRCGILSKYAEITELIRAKKYKQAERKCKEVLKIAETLADESESKEAVMRCHGQLAELYRLTGDSAGEIEEKRLAAAVYEEQILSPRRLVAFNTYCKSLADNGRMNESIQLQRQNLNKCEDNLGKEGNDKVGESCLALAEVLIKAGKKTEAIKELRRSLKHFDLCRLKRCCEPAVEASFLLATFLKEAGAASEAEHELQKTRADLSFWKDERGRSAVLFAEKAMVNKRSAREIKEVLDAAELYLKSEADLNIRREMMRRIGLVRAELSKTEAFM